MSESTKSSPSFISSDIKIDGHITSEGTVFISGHVIGNVKAKTLTLETTGSISGNINCTEAELLGNHKGNILSKKLSILSGAKIRGNIKCTELIVEHEANISGKINTSKS
tara:strand:+ start:405 stop:734 length:330 start_codon:yes stop_codon:yes gene_type:complete